MIESISPEKDYGTLIAENAGVLSIGGEMLEELRKGVKKIMSPEQVVADLKDQFSVEQLQQIADTLLNSQNSDSGEKVLVNNGVGVVVDEAANDAIDDGKDNLEITVPEVELKTEKEPQTVADKIYSNSTFLSLAGKVSSPLGKTSGDFNTHRYFLNNGEIVRDNFSNLSGHNAINSPGFTQACVHRLGTNSVLRPPKGETTIRYDAIKYDNGSTGVQFYISLVNNNHLWDHRNNGYPDYFMFDAPTDVAREFLLAVIDDAGVVLDVFLKFFHKHPEFLANYNRPEHAVIAKNPGLDGIGLDTQKVQKDKNSRAKTETIPYRGDFVVTQSGVLKGEEVSDLDAFINEMLSPDGKRNYKIPKQSTKERYEEYNSEPQKVREEFMSFTGLKELESMIGTHKDKYKFVRFIRNMFDESMEDAGNIELDQILLKVKAVLLKYENIIPQSVFKILLERLPETIFDFYQSSEEVKSAATVTELRQKFIEHGKKYDYIRARRGAYQVDVKEAIEYIDNGLAITSAEELFEYVENTNFSFDLKFTFNFDLMLVEEFFRKSKNVFKKFKLYSILNKSDYRGEKASRLHGRLMEFRPNLLQWQSILSYE